MSMKIYASAKVLGALRNYYFRYRKAREVGVAVFFGGGDFDSYQLWRMARGMAQGRHCTSSRILRHLQLPFLRRI
jgi:hypothetical protein